ncbi:uncharacterized protein LOC111343853 [Stylophora pistillata]|uniref:uncharacterized protein LOC111343853 n=1 Tax=Stylophora pistillata TaxID=50429 RepID=UPI000C0570C3|nr:uncharacterized protein LOC111343853 [Stylophora pistillata]
MAFAVKKAVKDKFRRNKRKGERDGKEVVQNSEDQNEKTVKEALNLENGPLSTKRPDQGNKRQTLPAGAENGQGWSKGSSQLSWSDQMSSSGRKDGNVEEAPASLDSTGRSDPNSLDRDFSYASEGPSTTDLSFERSRKGEASITEAGHADLENQEINPSAETLIDAVPDNLKPIASGATAATSSCGVSGGGGTAAYATSTASSGYATGGGTAATTTSSGRLSGCGGTAAYAASTASSVYVTGIGGITNAAGDTSPGVVTGSVGLVADAACDTSYGGMTGDGDGGSADNTSATSSGSVTGGGPAAASSGSVTDSGLVADAAAAAASSGSVTDSGLVADAAAAASSGSVTGGGAATGTAGDANATPSGSVTGIAAAGSTNVGGDDGALCQPENLPEGDVAQGDNSLPSLTTPPIQEESQETETADPTQNRGPEGEEELRNEETTPQGNRYEQFFVSNEIQENKFLEDMLMRKLDYTPHRCIHGWEYLACTQQVNAPLETRLRCKLVSRGSCTRTLIDLLVIEREDKTLEDLIAALKDIRRNDVVKMITAVYQDAENSIQTISEFAASSANADLIEKITTKLDERSRVNTCWIDLGRKFQISGEKLKEIELCGETNPTEALMKYLYIKQKDLTVQKFHEKVKKLKRGDVVKKLEPFLDANPEKRLWDAIDLESDEMRSICVDLNTQNRALKNWRHLANALEVPRDTYSDFNPQQPKSPTEELLNWIYAEKNDLTVGQLCAALESIGRNDVVSDLRDYFEPPPSEN